jgi:hypothetical protein
MLLSLFVFLGHANTHRVTHSLILCNSYVTNFITTALHIVPANIKSIIFLSRAQFLKYTDIQFLKFFNPVYFDTPYHKQ